MEIKDVNEAGYATVFAFDNCRVAVVNGCERLKEENMHRIERHFETDEVFILLQGEAVLHIGKDLKRYPMEKGKFYNVKHGEWHCITMSEETKVAVIENDDTSDENTERYYFRS